MTTIKETKYSSLEAPHKTRGASSGVSFRAIFLALAFFAATVADGVHFALSHQKSISLPQVTDPSSGAVAGEETVPAEKKLPLPKSFQVDMDKKAWPELVGKDGNLAQETIQGENPSIIKAQIVPKDSIMTMDYRTDRVRIFVNDDNTVASTPRIG